MLPSKQIPTVPSLYGGWPVRGGWVNSKHSSAELWPRPPSTNNNAICTSPNSRSLFTNENSTKMNQYVSQFSIVNCDQLMKSLCFLTEMDRASPPDYRGPTLCDTLFDKNMKYIFCTLFLTKDINNIMLPSQHKKFIKLFKIVFLWDILSFVSSTPAYGICNMKALSAFTIYFQFYPLLTW